MNTSVSRNSAPPTSAVSPRRPPYNARRTLCGSNRRARPEHRGQHRCQRRGAERVAELLRIGQQPFEQSDGLKDEDHRHREYRKPERNRQHGGEVLYKEQCAVLAEPRHIDLNRIRMDEVERIGDDHHNEDGDEKPALHPPLVEQQAQHEAEERELRRRILQIAEREDRVLAGTDQLCLLQPNLHEEQPDARRHCVF